MKSKRLFIGIPIEEETTKELERLQLQWKEMLGISSDCLLAKADFHLTLHFLGAIEEEQVSLWFESLEKHARLKSFNFVLNRFLAFPDISRARVITLAGAIGNSPLSHLFYQTAETVEAFGGKIETRVFIPHVTLFRGTGIKIEKPLEVEKPIEIHIASFALYESLAGKRESRYRVLRSFDLTTS